MKIKQLIQKLSLTHTEIERTYCIYFADYINQANSKKYTDISQRNIRRTGLLPLRAEAKPSARGPASPSARPPVRASSSFAERRKESRALAGRPRRRTTGRGPPNPLAGVHSTPGKAERSEAPVREGTGADLPTDSSKTQ